MSDNWQDDPMMKAAALEGIATNQAMPMADRLACAMQAIALLRARIAELTPDEERA